MPNPHLPALPDEITFASELIKARGELGLTQAQLAEKSGLSLSAIKAYESGRNMPGARELRELCQAVQVSPNKLLFGTELPFKDRGIGDMLVDGDSDEQAVMRVRLAMLTGMLASDERQSIYTLAKSIAVARHGEEKVREMTVGADMMAGIGRTFMGATRDALVKNQPIEVDGIGKKLEDFMEKQGHVSDPKKLPKE